MSRAWDATRIHRKHDARAAAPSGCLGSLGGWGPGPHRGPSRRGRSAQGPARRQLAEFLTTALEQPPSHQTPNPATGHQAQARRPARPHAGRPADGPARAAHPHGRPRPGGLPPRRRPGRHRSRQPADGLLSPRRAVDPGRLPRRGARRRAPGGCGDGPSASRGEAGHRRGPGSRPRPGRPWAGGRRWSASTADAGLPLPASYSASHHRRSPPDRRADADGGGRLGPSATRPRARSAGPGGREVGAEP